jgi:hypothetical protein
MHHFEAMKSSNVHFTFFRMGKILEGLLAGAVEAEVPHGVECLRDAKHIWERFGGVIDQLKHGSFNSVLHAVEDMGHVIHDIANELEECKATVGTDLDKLREMSKAFTDPWYFIFHVEHDLIVNGQDVHHEVMDAQAQWENQHFYEFGHSVGLALSKIALGGKMKNDIPVHHMPLTHHAEPVHHEAVHYDTYHAEPVHHEADYYHHSEPVHHEYEHTTYHYEEPHHYVERLAHHEYVHDEPRVVHDHPVHHEEPLITHPYHQEHHQEEPHVEFEHQAHGGPVHHEVDTYVPRHSHDSHDAGHHWTAEHEHDYAVHDERPLHHYYQ